MFCLKQYIPFVLVILLFLSVTGSCASSWNYDLQVPMPDFKEQSSDKIDWREMSKKGSLALRNLLSSAWSETSNNPRLVCAVLSTACIFILGHKYGAIVSKKLGTAQCDKAINEKYLSAKNKISSTISPISSYVSNIPSISGASFLVSPLVGVIKYICGSVEDYFLHSKKYLIGSFATGGGFYICGHPVVAGWFAALILAKGWFNQDLDELKRGQEDIKNQINETGVMLEKKIELQGAETRQQISSTEQKLSDQAAKNAQALKAEMQGLSVQMDELSQGQQKMKQQIVASARQTDERLQQAETHIDEKIDIAHKDMVGEIFKIDQKMVEMLGKIDSVAQEAARKELIGQLDDLNKKSENLKAEFCQSMQMLADQGKLTQEKVDDLREQMQSFYRQVESLKNQGAVNSAILGEMNSKVGCMMDENIKRDEKLSGMQNVLLKVQSNVVQQIQEIEKLVLSNNEVQLLCSTMKGEQIKFSDTFAQITNALKEDNKQSVVMVSNFLSQNSQDIAAIRQEIFNLKQENVKRDSQIDSVENLAKQNQDILMKVLQRLEDQKKEFAVYRVQQEKQQKAQQEELQKQADLIKKLLEGQTQLGEGQSQLRQDFRATAVHMGQGISQILHNQQIQSSLLQQNPVIPGLIDESGQGKALVRQRSVVDSLSSIFSSIR